MPEPTQSSAVLHRLRPRALVSGLAASVAFAAVMLATSCSHRPPPGSVAVDPVPPDACVAYYGPGPCREHGATIIGSTDAVAGPPSAGWRGKVQAPEPRP